ncbi:tRNA-specific adenosine deaminase TAD3 [Salvia miltiorrhiza]|uniref:tRNA-specific adenosine deaminase TAD3 n=1 Tax=Salvia miltiorrhiza TaxID=226208 RepID=UPI0025AD9B47|nr:tRNA-specific adenosine deaminase TAD3 [Salvia miltiorrhiza]
MKGSADGETAGPSQCWEIVHIPGKPPISPELQPTVDVLASAIDAKHANTIVRKLNHIAPLEGLRHVKRVKKTVVDGGKSQLFVIICMDSGSNAESNYMPEDVQGLMNTYQLSTFTTKVCKYAATTKEEWEEQCKLWPTSFHPPTFNIDGITGFTEEDSLSVLNFMKHAVRMAKSGASLVNAAVIVDPLSGEIIASSCDEVLYPGAPTKGSSKESCCSKYRETTIQGDANEMEKSLISNEAKQSYMEVSCLHPWGWLEQRLHSNLDSWHPLRHAAIVAIEASAARDRHLFPTNVRGADPAHEDPKVLTPTGSPLKRQKVKNDERLDCNTNGSKYDSTRPYLCTGYDIYFVWEPCAMCSMAIVHQRIRRVFYAFPNPNDGALGSVHRLQGERSLNHHYAVFRVMLPKEILD